MLPLHMQCFFWSETTLETLTSALVTIVLNAAAVKYNLFLPSLPEALQQFTSTCFFSRLDMAFHSFVKRMSEKLFFQALLSIVNI